MRSVDEILSMVFPDTDLLLDNGYLTKGESLVWLGSGGIGKSRLVMQQAICSIIGRPFLDMTGRGHGHRWLFLQTENSCRRLQADLACVRAWLNDDEWDQLRQCLRIHTLETDVDSFLSLSRVENHDRIREAIADFLPDVVVWDPLKDFAIGNLNNDMDMQETVMAISQVTLFGNPKRIPLVVHHAGTGRAGALKAVGYDRNGFGRNSKLLHNWTRAQINVVAYEPDTCDALIVSSGKCNNYAEFRPFGVRLDPKTMIYATDSTIDVDAWQERVNGGEKAKPTYRDIPSILKDRCLSRQELCNKICSRFEVAAQTAYRWITQADENQLIRLDQTHKTYDCAQ